MNWLDRLDQFLDALEFRIEQLERLFEHTIDIEV